MESKKPNLDDLQRAFSVTTLEPEISEALLIAYASGKASDVDRDLVETMLDVDPGLSDLISAIQEELAHIDEPLPSPIRALSPSQKSGWLQRWFGIGSSVVALGALGLLLLAFLERGRLLQDVRSKDLQVASAFDTNRKNVQSLQQKIDSMEHELKSSKTDKQKLLAQLDQTRTLLKTELAARSREAVTPDGVESMVAHALTRGLSMPASLFDISTTRGPSDLRVTMSPDRTSVRLPVKLSWSGPREGDFRVEIVQAETPVWKTRATESDATPPNGLLKPGVVYSWRVASGTKRGPWAAFRTCTEVETNRANRIDRDSQLGPLEKGVVYAAIGLAPDAEAQFKLLRASHPSLADRLTKQLEQFRK